MAPRVLAGDISTLMKQLVDFRGELETLSLEVDQVAKERQAQVDLWNQKKTELQSALQKEQFRRLQITEKTKALASRIKIHEQGDPKSQGLLVKWIKRAETWVENSLPYRREIRLKTLAELKRRGQLGLESQESLVAELWRFFESELKMSGDNEFRIVDVQTSSGLRKAEVARLGLYSMYAAFPDGQVKQATVRDKVWSLHDLEGEERANALRLLTNLKAKRESGLYRLPIMQGTERL
jgi:hypothetical protein